MEKKCSNQAETEKLAAAIASAAKAGDLFALNGDLGAGKSTFARAFIRALLDNPEAEVPSPTFTLVQLYDVPLCSVFHTDLYRIKDPDEVYDLGLDDERGDSILLVEWPDRMPAEWWDNALVLSLKQPEGAPVGIDEARLVTFSGNEERWHQILKGGFL
ncbi:tRNA (adenosine(37)-N6)-threonylcarbamoyltransferase complex ATPase subunit type 1 TsaE [Kordiimonas pumila]|uniref:tRNA threonylcarbamoyladenosine biosynthesis protein TsaE n=1 Tax=Kordiimonas pumila TaxID=2161677 RepID=A0ABV7D094_9PROT|nr:tRNA (adenosine(37)-N6)-threonylcarbamoyltransferase complex ATPase subunit type 1 TsaE [Kordiimonas pumila]